MRWNNERGESITESLAAMLLAALSVLLLAGAVVSAARVNRAAQVEDWSFSHENPEEQSCLISFALDGDTLGDFSPVDQEDTACSGVQVTVYTTENGYHYYAFLGYEAAETAP